MKLSAKNVLTVGTATIFTLSITAIPVYANNKQPAPKKTHLVSWNRALLGPKRYEPALDQSGEAFLDTSTGLVWTLPATFDGQIIKTTWRDAQRDCKKISFGGVSGWRLPEIDEIATLAYTPPDRPDFVDIIDKANPIYEVLLEIVDTRNITFWTNTVVEGIEPDEPWIIDAGAHDGTDPIEHSWTPGCCGGISVDIEQPNHYICVRGPTS